MPPSWAFPPQATIFISPFKPLFARPFSKFDLKLFLSTECTCVEIPSGSSLRQRMPCECDVMVGPNDVGQTLHLPPKNRCQICATCNNVESSQRSAYTWQLVAANWRGGETDNQEGGRSSDFVDSISIDLRAPLS